MKKPFLIFHLLLFSILVYPHSSKTDVEYALIFGSCFDKNQVSLKINKTTVFSQYRLGYGTPAKKENLSLKQTSKGIELFYNGSEIKKSKIKFDNVLNIEITLNGKPNKFQVDLRKGNILLIQFCSSQNDGIATKKLTIEQRQEAVILM